MKSLWSLTIDEYLEIIEISKELGIKPGESMEPVFLAYMNIKGQKPDGHTELTKEELLTELTFKNQKILDISVNSDGQTTYKIIKKNNSIDK